MSKLRDGHHRAEIFCPNLKAAKVVLMWCDLATVISYLEKDSCWIGRCDFWKFWLERRKPGDHLTFQDCPFVRVALGHNLSCSLCKSLTSSCRGGSYRSTSFAWSEVLPAHLIVVNWSTFKKLFFFPAPPDEYGRVRDIVGQLLELGLKLHEWQNFPESKQTNKHKPKPTPKQTNNTNKTNKGNHCQGNSQKGETSET